MRAKSLNNFQTLVDMGNLQDPVKTAKMLQEFEKQNMKMEMTDEMSEFLNEFSI